MQKYLPYAGIGSRETPVMICSLMTDIARWMEQQGFTLRSGHADGADKAFEAGVSLNQNKEIYIPWKGFNGSDSPRYQISAEHFRIAQNFHPAWDRCSDGAKKLHARNVAQIMGQEIRSYTLSKMIICWTKNGSRQGGTGQALRMAEAANIPIFDLGLPQLMHTCEQIMIHAQAIRNQ